jgi:hypothetical protein
MVNFFNETRSFAFRNRQLFDFVHTSSVALWNLRWQVQGYVGARPQATADEISAGFAGGTNIRANNLKGTCVEAPWEDQLSQFAQIISANLIAMYEGWAEELMSKFDIPGLTNQVQWPSKGSYGQKRDGVSEALASARSAGVSEDMKRAFFPIYSANRKYSLAHLDALLTLYRYHKEIRNSFMHRGGVANDAAEAAWYRACTLTRADIGLRSSPYLTRMAEGVSIKTNIFEAIQLSDVLLRIVTTIDAELCFSNPAEKEFINSWRGIEKLKTRFFPGDEPRKASRMVSACRKAGYVKPEDTEAIYQIGRRAGLVY